jgi:hypothetical protein
MMSIVKNKLVVTCLSVQLQSATNISVVGYDRVDIIVKCIDGERYLVPYEHVDAALQWCCRHNDGTTVRWTDGCFEIKPMVPSKVFTTVTDYSLTQLLTGLDTVIMCSEYYLDGKQVKFIAINRNNTRISLDPELHYRRVADYCEYCPHRHLNSGNGIHWRLEAE